MDATPGPENLPNLLPDEAEVLLDPGVGPKDSIRVHRSKLDMRCSGLHIQHTTIPRLTGKVTRDAGVRSVTESSAQTTSGLKQGEQSLSPLRLALARLSVKKQIFTYMDQGDKKTDIESRTGLSHQCIKWHRRLWRDECSHPRPLSKKISKRSAQDPRSPGTQSERPLRRRPVCDEKGDSSVAGKSSDDMRRRKHQAKKQSKEGSVRTEVEMHESGEKECAEMKMTESGCFADKENLPERGEAMAISSELKILPFRDVGS